MKIIKITHYQEIPSYFTGKIEWSDGQIEYRKNGIVHRLNGPAIIYSHGEKRYFCNGKLHRLDGPAVIWFDNFHNEENYEYWINDKYLTDNIKHFELYTNLLKLKGVIK